MNKLNKRGLSPIIATVLLISIALVLAIIIFLWARSFLAEKPLKLEKNIDLNCEDLVFRVEAYEDSGNGVVRMTNDGDVPISKVEIKKKEAGSVESIGEFGFSGGTLTSGKTMRVNDNLPINTGDEITVIPILYGLLDEQIKSWTCADKYGVSTTVD